MQEHADTRPPGSTWRGRSENDGLPDAATPGPVVQVRWFIQEPDLHRSGSADARAIEGAELLASSPLYPNQLFRYGGSYGIQFHVEADAALVGEALMRQDDPL